MILFATIRSTYGIATVRLARDLERQLKSLARFKQHLTFIYKCLKAGVTPRGFQVKPRLYSSSGVAAAKRYEFRLLKIWKTQCHSRIAHLSASTEQNKFLLEKSLSTTHY